MSSRKGVIDMNNEIQLGVIESRFADMIWERAPITSTELVKLAERELRWKRTTTYTVIKRLCERGVVKSGESAHFKGAVLHHAVQAVREQLVFGIAASIHRGFYAGGQSYAAGG